MFFINFLVNFWKEKFSTQIEKIIKGEKLPPIKKNGSAEGEESEQIPDHVKKLMEQRKLKETTPKDDSD